MPGQLGFIPLIILGSLVALENGPAERIVTLAQSASTVPAYEFVEVTLTVTSPHADNCFTDATVKGQFEKLGSGAPRGVNGFCDAADGSLFRIRFMPEAPGDYSYSVVYQQGAFTKAFVGRFTATDGRRRGVVRGF